MDGVKVKFVKINLKNNCKSAGKYLLTFLKWFALAAVTGAVGGVVGALFHLSVEYVTGVRKAHSWIVFLLPVGGLVIAGLYKLSGKKDIGTNEILDAVRSPQGVPVLLAPLIFVSTVITHLFGGSAGREGAALQLGGSIAGLIGKISRLDEKDMHIMTMCGMSAVFSALFGTPITAAVFALGVISVGVIYYAGLLPCVVSAFVAYFISTLMGTEPVAFTVSNIPAFSLKSCLLTALLAAICALLSIGFCLGLHGTHKLFAKLFKNTFVRAVVGGLIIVALSLICRSGDYNGAGMDIVERAIGGNAKPEAFLLKFIFTAVTVGSGYKGGEIVPTFLRRRNFRLRRWRTYRARSRICRGGRTRLAFLRRCQLSARFYIPEHRTLRRAGYAAVCARRRCELSALRLLRTLQQPENSLFKAPRRACEYKRKVSY